MDPLAGVDAERYRRLFRAVGERWLWAGHIAKSRDEIAAILDAPEIETWATVDTVSGIDIGVLQLKYDEATGAELLYFGLVPEAIGKGLGRWLLQTAMARAFTKGARRFWLHTCNFDHPNAIAFYQRAGLKVYATGFEVMDDPRVSGLLPETAAPHVPLVPRDESQPAESAGRSQFI